MAQPQPYVPFTEPQSSPAIILQSQRPRFISYPIDVTRRITWSYFKTTLGAVKIIQLAIAIVCMACFGEDGYDTGFLEFVVYSCFILTVTFTVFQLFNFQKIWPKIPFLYVELIYTIIGTILYFVAGIAQFSLAMSLKHETVHPLSRKHKVLVGFAILNVVAYALSNVFIVFKIKKTNEAETATQPAVNPSVA